MSRSAAKTQPSQRSRALLRFSLDTPSAHAPSHAHTITASHTACAHCIWPYKLLVGLTPSREPCNPPYSPRRQLCRFRPSATTATTCSAAPDTPRPGGGNQSKRWYRASATEHIPTTPRDHAPKTFHAAQKTLSHCLFAATRLLEGL